MEQPSRNLPSQTKPAQLGGGGHRRHHRHIHCNRRHRHPCHRRHRRHHRKQHIQFDLQIAIIKIVRIWRILT